jgi:alpha-glucosidase (family GH31 glycosyl hydrolase)
MSLSHRRSGRLAGGSVLRCASCLAALALSLPSTVRAAEPGPVVLESAVLRLEVTAEPYGYRVLEKKSGEVLVEHAAVQMGVAGGPPVAKAAKLKAAGRAVSAELIAGEGAAIGQVRFRFQAPEVLSVELQSKAGGGTVSVKQELRTGDERNYGLFEYAFGGRLDNAGLDADLLGVGRMEGVWYASGRAPFYLTSRKHGVYVRSTARGRYSVGKGGKTGFAFDGPALRYDIIYGPGYLDMLARYTRLAGAPFMPPLWAFGSAWWSDDFQQALHDTKNAQENVLEIAGQLAKHKIHAGSICMDRPYGSGEMGWGNFDFGPSFPDARQMIKELKAQGLEVTVWAANRAWNRLYDEASAKGLLFPSDKARGPALDLRKREAYDLLKKKLDGFVQMGVKGYKIDRGEQTEYPDAAQNEQVTLFHKLAYEGMTARHGRDVFSFARNVYDTGRRYTAVWNGDTPITFEGLRYSVLTGLRSGMILMPMWGSDTGGYVPSPQGPPEELFARWLAFSAWSPLMEVLVGGKHTPWYDYSPRLVEITRAQAAAHHDLIPYTRSFMYQATQTGAPIMRPLVFAYPDDARVATMGDQYLYGSELLVAPVLEAGATKRAVYLPAGRWIDYHDRQTVHEGGKSIVAEAPIDRIPVYARQGAIVPRGDILKGNNTWTPSWSPRLRVEVFPAPAGQERFSYYDGRRARVIATAVEGGRVTIELPDLGAPGDLEVYLRQPGRVLRGGKALVADRDYEVEAAANRITIPFRGAGRYQIEGQSLFGTPSP